MHSQVCARRFVGLFECHGQPSQYPIDTRLPAMGDGGEHSVGDVALPERALRQRHVVRAEHQRPDGHAGPVAGADVDRHSGPLPGRPVLAHHDEKHRQFVVLVQIGDVVRPAAKLAPVDLALAFDHEQERFLALGIHPQYGVRAPLDRGRLRQVRVQDRGADLVREIYAEHTEGLSYGLRVVAENAVHRLMC